MKRLFLAAFVFILSNGTIFAQSGYIYPTADLLKQSRELFYSLNKNRIDGETFMDLLATSHNEQILPQQVDGKFAYVDTKAGKQKFKSVFDAAFPYNNGYALVVSDGKQGIINESGRWVVKPSDPLFNDMENNGMYLDARRGKIDYILNVEPTALAYTPFKQNGKWGIIESDAGNPIIPYEYDAIVALDINGFIALKNNRLGYVRMSDNKPLSTFSYVRLSYTEEDLGLNSLHYFALYDMEAEVWDYYASSYSGLKKLFSANHYGFNYRMGEFCVAKFRIGDEYNLFFEDGSTLPNTYKWITDLPSQKLILAIDKNDRIVIVNKQGDEFVVSN